MDISHLRGLLDYDAESGELRWKERPGNNRFNTKYAGRPALTARNSAGYPHGQIDGHCFLAHRVAWAIAHGQWPESEIDHINRDRADYRLDNLRPATRRQNCYNRPRRGVGVYRRNQKWMATAGREYLGVFSCFGHAVAARNERLFEVGASDV